MIRFSLLLVNLIMLAFAIWIVAVVAHRDSILISIAPLTYFVGIITISIECMIDIAHMKKL